MFEEIKEDAKTRFIPIIRDESLKLLTDLCAREKPKKILEIGTAVGYSALAMLFSCSAQVTTIEKDKVRLNEALQNFEKYRVSNRVTALEGDAGEILQSLNERFDLIFLDGAKGQYIKYLPHLKRLLNDGGVLFADDIYLHGFVRADEVSHKHRSMVMNLRAFIDTLKSDPDLDTTFYDIEDGISLSRKK